MTNEEFQKIILTEIRELKLDIKELKQDTEMLKLDTKELKQDTEMLKLDTKELKQDTEMLKLDTKELKQDTEKLKYNINVTIEQTAMLTEFKTEVTQKLDTLIENQKSFYEVLGEHEIAIRNLRRKPV